MGAQSAKASDQEQQDQSTQDEAVRNMSEPARQASGSLEPGSVGIPNDVHLEASGKDEPIIGGNTINQLNHDQLQAEAAYRGIDASGMGDAAIREQLVNKANGDLEVQQKSRDLQTRNLGQARV